MTRPNTIAIDGPVASGKTTVAKLLSRELGYRFLDTGIMYRAVTWLALERGVDLDGSEALGRLARETSIDLPVGQDNGDSGVVTVDGRKVSQELREPQVDRAVSLVSMSRDVRGALVEQQRRIANGGQIVVVGRDIGTVVLPSADIKIFLMAEVGERARRRYAELSECGENIEYDSVLGDLEARDKLDTERAQSPLRPAQNAFLLVTDGLDLKQVMEKVRELVG